MQRQGAVGRFRSLGQRCGPWLTRWGRCRLLDQYAVARAVGRAAGAEQLQAFWCSRLVSTPQLLGQVIRRGKGVLETLAAADQQHAERVVGSIAHQVMRIHLRGQVEGHDALFRAGVLVSDAPGGSPADFPARVT